jgi:hypothetical protein
VTNDDAKRRILERVANGSLTPTEAAEQIAALDAAPIEADEPAPDRELAAARDVGPSNVRIIKVRGTFRAVDVIGDPSVREAVATGRHVAHHEDDDTLVIDAGLDVDDEDDEDDDDWFSMRRGFGPPWRSSTYRRHIGVRIRNEAALQVRMNPDLELDARIEAGPLTIRDVRGPIRARVAAGPLKLDGFESPVDLHVSAGPIKARGRLDHGESHVQCEAGSVNLRLDESSSVRIKASATLGKVHLLGQRERDRDRERDRGRDWHWEDLAGGGVSRIVGNVLGTMGDNHEATIGAGAGTLDVEVAMGAVHIDAD